MSEAQLSRGQIERLLEVGRTLVSELDLEALLGQVLEAAHDLTGARYAALGILDPGKRSLERFVYRGIDEETRRRIGALPRGRGVLGELIAHPEPLRLDDVSSHPRSYGFPAGHPEMATFLGVPIMIRGEAWGNLYLTEKAGGQPFGETDERLVVVLSEWAAIAVDNARLVETQKLRLSIEASERERRRWARELHDETLQELGALQVLIDAVSSAREPARAGQLLERAASHVERGIRNLQGLITELRPAALDELGVGPAVGALAERVGEVSGLRIEAELELGREHEQRLAPELEAAIYRLVQEGLNNVVKHAEAEAVQVRIVEADGVIEVSVRDDGRGFHPAGAGGGFGLVGMRERAALLGGRLSISSEPGRGTELRATLPVSGGARASGPEPATGS